MKMRLHWYLWVLLALISTRGAPVDFGIQIQPILEQKCYRCHDAEKVKGDLRLDSPAGIMAGGKGGPVLAPGKPDESPLYFMTTFSEGDPDYMPQKGKGLSTKERGLLKTWIEEGASFWEGYVHVPVEKIKSKFSQADSDEMQKYRIAGEAIEMVAELRSSGLLVDTVNHDASLFEVSYTYADRKAGQFGFSSLEALSDSLRKVTLARTEVTIGDLKSLQPFSSIEFLDLSRTGIGDEALDPVSKLENLKTLNLRDTNVSDKGLQKLVGLDKLERVHVWGSLVTPEGAKWLENRLEGVVVNVGVPIRAPARRNGPQA